MQRIIGVTELQRRFRAVFDEVAKNRVPYILTRGSRPEAVLIPYAEFVRYQTLQELGGLAQGKSLPEQTAPAGADASTQGE